MIKIFFGLVFIAELIIATALVIYICILDFRVNKLNDAIKKNKFKIAKNFRYIKFLLKLTNHKINKCRKLAKQKQAEYTLRLMKTSIIYLGLLALKGKYKKALLGYQIGCEIFEAIKEA